MGLNSKIIIGFLIALALIAGLEFNFEGGALMYCMLFFVAISMGPIAIVAAVDIAGSQWIKPYKKILLSTRHMILLIPFLFIVFWASGKLHLYGWTEHETGWLNQNFFVLRNVLVLLFAWVMANKFASVSLNDAPGKVKWGVLWELTYVVTQTLVAVDWVMSLDYPWISTLFGAYFFVEAFYSGLALAAIITFFKYQSFNDQFPKTFKNSQMDMMTMMFGFSIFWAYQFFSQYLVIWYGNIPEEVAFLVHRLEIYSNLMYLVLISLFVIPFITMLSRKVKGNPVADLVLGILVLSGILLERFFMIAPHMTLNPVITIVEFLVLAVLFVMVLRTSEAAEVTS
ncbi:MAG: hypothetical protein D6748_16500 [Calditrichaeota bacterium]|nr:MAG: hypothetical protein D6748_16500 [Calditrichota bacterium]